MQGKSGHKSLIYRNIFTFAECNLTCQEGRNKHVLINFFTSISIFFNNPERHSVQFPQYELPGCYHNCCNFNSNVVPLRLGRLPRYITRQQFYALQDPVAQNDRVIAVLIRNSNVNEFLIQRISKAVLQNTISTPETTPEAMSKTTPETKLETTPETALETTPEAIQETKSETTLEEPHQKPHQKNPTKKTRLKLTQKPPQKPHQKPTKPIGIVDPKSRAFASSQFRSHSEQALGCLCNVNPRGVCHAER